MNSLEARRRLLGRNVYKRTTEGNPAIAQDSLARMYPGIEMQGWTEQPQYDGKNLINQDETIMGGLVGSTANEFDATDRIRTGFIRVEPNTTYIISGLSGFNIANSFAYDSEKLIARRGAVTTTTTTTLENESYLRMSFSKPDQSDFTEEELQKLRKTLMFNEGDVALPWEPYTGGQPSPSPDYPQPITSAGKYNEETGKWDYEVKLTGANLFDISKVITAKGYLMNNGDGTLTATPGPGNSAVAGKAPRTLRDYCPELISGKTYRLSANSTGTNKRIYLLGTNISWSYNGHSITITDADLESEVYFYASGENTEAVISDIMITEVEDADYEPYRTPQTVTLTSDRPLTKWDKLEKRNGQWGWVYGSVEVDMSSEVTWDIHQDYEQETSNLFRGVMSGVDEIDSTDMLLCNILPYYQAASLDRNGIYTLDNNFFVRIVGIKSLEDFQEKIQGGKVLTKLSTETFVPLTTAEQEAMNALYTFRPTTVLSNDAGCNMELTYKTKKNMRGGVIHTD